MFLGMHTQKCFYDVTFQLVLGITSYSHAAVTEKIFLSQETEKENSSRPPSSLEDVYELTMRIL